MRRMRRRMEMGFTEHELYIIDKMIKKAKWCNRHISRADLLKGRYRDEIILKCYEDAIDNLVNKKILYIYEAEGRRGYCIKKADEKMLNSARYENAGKIRYNL